MHKVMVYNNKQMLCLLRNKSSTTYRTKTTTATAALISESTEGYRFNIWGSKRSGDV